MVILFKRKQQLPFEGKRLATSSTSLELVYDLCLDFSEYESDLAKSLRPRWNHFKDENEIEVMEGHLVIKGKKFPVGDKVVRIFLTSLNIIIVRDVTPYHNIHAFNLNGDHLWDIEGCNTNLNERAYSLGSPCGINVSENGRDLLMLDAYPVTYATDLLTGKGTRIFEIEDNTDTK